MKKRVGNIQTAFVLSYW